MTVSGARSRRWLAIAILLAVAIGVGWLVMDRARRVDNDAQQRWAADAARATATRTDLAPQPGAAGGARSTQTPSAGGDAVGKNDSKASTPTSAAAGSRERASKTVAVRLDLGRTTGNRSPIEISRVHYRGEEWPGDALSRIPVYPNTGINLLTTDPRAAATGVYLRIPESIPDVLEARIPALDDPRLGTLDVEVVDANTNAPIAGATLLLEDRDPLDIHSDASGMIHLAPADVPGAAPPLLVWWFETAWSLHAKGYFSVSRIIGVWHVAAKSPGVRLLPAEEAARWLDHGALRVALRPLEASWREREFRLVDASGAPVKDVLVVASLPWRGFVTRHETSPGAARKPDSNGLVSFPLPDDARVFGIDVFRDGSPIAATLLDGTQWPAAGPRGIRLPALADVELVLEGAPIAEEISASGVPHPAARSPANGPAFPVEMDAAVRKVVDEQHLVFMTGFREVLASAPKGQNTIRFAMPVHTTKTLWLSGGAAVTIEATKPGPLRVVRRWDEIVPRDDARPDVHDDESR